MPYLPLFLVLATRGSFWAYGESSAIHYATMFKGVHIPFELVKEQLESKEIGRFVLPAPKFSIQ